MRGKISKWGNSLGVRIPKAIAESAGLADGQIVELSAKPGSVALRRINKRPRYTLEELVQEMKRLGPENEPETVEWGPDVGSEIIDDAYSRGEITPEDQPNGKRST